MDKQKVNDLDISHANPYRDKDGKFTSKELAEFIVGNLSNPEQPKQPAKQQSEQAPTSKAIQDVSKGLQNLSSSFVKLPVKPGETRYGTYPDISDKELQDYINRISLERKYSDIVGDTKYVKSGSEKSRETLQTVGAVAGIGASIFSILYAISEFRRKRP